MTDVETFSAHREHLLGVAYRMLGTRGEAEDAVQEAWLRYSTSRTAEIQDARAWLTTVTGRICLDILRSARVRREAYVGPWLPEPFVDRLPDPDADPADRAVVADQVSVALLVVLEALGPEQRIAFVLHDVFGVPFEEVATALDTTPANARQLASRARKAVATGERRHTSDLGQQRRVLDAFLAAAAGGSIDDLLKLLAPDVVALGDGGGVAPAARSAIVGPLRVARFIAGIFKQTARLSVVVEPVLVNGDLGFLFEAADYNGRSVRSALVLTVSPEGLVNGFYNQLNPAKLTRVPAPDPARAITLPFPSGSSRDDPSPEDPSPAGHEPDGRPG